MMTIEELRHLGTDMSGRIAHLLKRGLCKISGTFCPLPLATSSHAAIIALCAVLDFGEVAKRMVALARGMHASGSPISFAASVQLFTMVAAIG